jgi:hypothetical protein
MKNNVGTISKSNIKIVESDKIVKVLEKEKYIPFSLLPLNIIGLSPSNRLCLSHIIY